MNNSISHIECDVVVAGGGNAGLCVALAAAQSNAGSVVLIDKCPEEWAEGNSYFTAGAFRTAHGGLPDMLPIVNNVDEKTAEMIDLESYTREDFLADLSRVTHGWYDRELGQELVEGSNEAVKWLAENGLKFQLSFNRQVSSGPTHWETFIKR
jgi:succinate dehydrogenase/fumarate reductase flavoprotein subunit